MVSQHSDFKIKDIIQRKGVGTGFAAGGMLSMLATTAFQAVYPTFSTRVDAISLLGGVGEPTAIFWNSAIIIAGLLWLMSSFKLFHHSGRNFTSVPFYLSGLGFLMVGLSPWDQYPITHSIGAHFVAIFGAISALVAWRYSSGSISRISLVAGAFSIFSLLGGYFGFANLLGSGGVERMIFYPIMLWEIAFGGYLLGLESNLGDKAKNSA